MVFTISPTEAQAIQEDEAQLIYAISQVARGIAISLNQHPPQTPEQPDTLRIQMGRRLVYGQMAKGPFRNELNADTIKAIFDAIQRPVTPDIEPEQYQGKLPAIEIRNGEDILFREERDGAITINKIQLQLDQTVDAESKQAGVSTPTSAQNNGKVHLSEVDPAEVSSSVNGKVHPSTIEAIGHLEKLI
ncbi:MAG: hypothetical protein MJA27_36475 [Pseudanabaenales cyanobacterium]|nr:hypothetical protein [Pseudanabaenales cyanobacterium]